MTNFEQLKAENNNIIFKIILFYDSLQTVRPIKEACEKSGLEFNCYNVLIHPDKLVDLHTKEPDLNTVIIFEDLQKLFASFTPKELSIWESFILSTRKLRISIIFTLHDISSSQRNQFAKFLIHQSTQLVVFRAIDVTSKKYIGIPGKIY